MQFKVDENLHEEIGALLNLHGHDAATVKQQRMQGHSDYDIAVVCRSESRAIITLDLDFANIVQFPPGDYPGIIVLRLHDQSRGAVFAAVLRLLPEIATQPLVGNLWIVDEQKTRVRRGVTE